MKNILFLTDTYYPDSRATTVIAQNIAEEFVQRGHSVGVYTMHVANSDIPQYEESHNGVKIYNSKPENASLYCKTVSKIAGQCMRKQYEIEREYELLHIHSKHINNIVREKNIHIIVSFSLPIDIHICANMVAKRNDSLVWIPVCLDPYAYNQETSSGIRSKREVDEKKLYERANKVFMLTQAIEDYKNNELNNKIIYFQLPNISEKTRNQEAFIQFDERYINCVYTGALHYKTRNPDCLFELLWRLEKYNIRVYVVGGLYGEFPKGYLEQWEEKLQGRMIHLGRVKQKDAIDMMVRADILLNIGNTTSNQCPSKVLDYISTGKPILHISKIQKCASLEYLNRYPLHCAIFESECFFDDQVDYVGEFLLKNKGKQLEYEKVLQLYSDCTIKNVVDKMVKELR